MVIMANLTKLERLFAALYVSEGWYEKFLDYYTEKNKTLKQFGLFAKMRGVIIYDRIMDDRFDLGIKK